MPDEEAAARRFDAVADHPDYEDAMADEPHVSTTLYQAITTVMLGMAGSFVLVGLVLLVIFPPFGLPWVAMCLGFAWLAYQANQEAREYARAPIQRSIRLVLRTRTEVSGGGDSSATTTYFVTLADRDGDRIEWRADGRVVGILVEGDIGVAYTKRNRLVDFRRFDV